MADTIRQPIPAPVEEPAHGQVTPEQLEHIFSQMGPLPSLPQANAKLLELISSTTPGATAAPDTFSQRAPSVSEGANQCATDSRSAAGLDDTPADVASQITQLVCLDIALSARILSQAPPLLSVQQAVAAIGIDAVKSIALSAQPPEPEPSEDIYTFDLQAFWRHSLAVACAAQLLATRMELGAAPHEAFTLGLLHDLGKFALAHALPKSYARVSQLKRTSNTTSWELERKIIGIDHCLAGRRLAQMWRFHPIICDAIWLNRQPLEAIPTSMPHRRLIAAIGLADMIARQDTGNPNVARMPSRLAGQLGLDESTLGEITSALKTAVDQRCEPLRDSKPANPRQYRQALHAANAQLAALNERLRQRTIQLDAQARAFDLLRNFFAALRPDSSVPQLLAAAAHTLCNAISIRPAADQPVVAYSLSQGANGVLAVRLDGSDTPQWKLFQRADTVGAGCHASANPAVWDLRRHDAQGSSNSPFEIRNPQSAIRNQDAYQAARSLLDDPHDLADWIDLPTYRHQPLICAGGWVGGVFYRAAAISAACEPGPDDLDAIAGALALALAIVQGRARAVSLGEELASASQILGDTQNALAQARTLSTISEMAAGAAHEINNPLAVISGRAQLMAEKADDDEGRKVWQTITLQAQRISDIITALNDFANPQPPQPQPIDPAQLLHDAAAAFNSSDHPQAKSARVDIDVHTGTPVICADGQQALAVITELIVNAANAATTAAGIRLWAQPDPTGKAVLIGVQDDGPGMDQATLAAAFTPFFSSQKAGRRRGLGLPTARRYVENNGGAIWLRSQVGQGTLVQISLPAQESVNSGQ